MRKIKLTHTMNRCPNCPLCAIWCCVQRLIRLLPRRYYKRFRVGRFVVWVFPFWWCSSQEETVVGKTIGPITYLLKANAVARASADTKITTKERIYDAKHH